jgi:hypothetical protein
MKSKKKKHALPKLHFFIYFKGRLVTPLYNKYIKRLIYPIQFANKSRKKIILPLKFNSFGFYCGEWKHNYSLAIHVDESCYIFSVFILIYEL